MRTRSLPIVAACALLLAVVAGCGDGPPSPPGGRVTTVDVQMTGAKKFVPDSVTITVGDTVRWKNIDGAAQHTATRKDDPAFDSGLLAQGETFSFTFTKASGASGFDYVCTPHASMGMKGVVIVQEAK